jgi:hypothetical protein
MACEIHKFEDGGFLVLCGRRFAKPRRCAFCSETSSVLCDGERCTRALCDAHRWSAAAELDFCPPCEAKVLLEAATPLQIGLW